jgi:two-component system, cell cycle sensor histidine kinase and response regulator CckA
VGKVLISTGNVTFDESFCTNNPGAVPGDYVVLAVCDDGCGMDRETQDKIFEPFFTTKEMGKGTGLGLATLYGIVKQNNGFINVYSEPGMGTAFKIYLIRYRGEAGGQLREELPAEPIAKGNETILLVEDDPSILNMITIMLTHLGYTVLAASTPDEAIRLTEAHLEEIRLLMADVVMPGMYGRDLAGKLLSLWDVLDKHFNVDNA